MKREILRRLGLGALVLLFLGSVFSAYLYREGGEARRDREIAEFLEGHSEGGVVVCDLDAVKEAFPGGRYVSSQEGEAHLWSLPLFLTEVDASLVVASNRSWMYEQWREYPALLTPLAAFPTSLDVVTVYEANLEGWRRVRGWVEGEVVLTDDPRIARFAGRAVRSWETEGYGWRKEEFLLRENVTRVVYYGGEETAVDELFSDEPYLEEVGRVALDRAVVVYEVDRGLLSREG